MSMVDFFEEITGITNAAYGDAKKVELGFIPQAILIHLRVGTDPIYFSFGPSGGDDGVVGANQGYLQSIQMDISRNEIWFRGGSGDEEIQVWAWA